MQINIKTITVLVAQAAAHQPDHSILAKSEYTDCGDEILECAVRIEVIGRELAERYTA